MYYAEVMEIEEVISRNFKRLRAESGLTQEKVAKGCGVNIQTIKDIEAGRRKPSVDLIFAMATVFKIDSGKILEQEESAPVEKPLPFKTILGMYSKLPEQMVKDLASFRVDDPVWKNIEVAIRLQKEEDQKTLLEKAKNHRA